jgi:two-component system OmpR family response regulator
MTASTPHILVVEDDHEIGMLVAKYLRTNEYRVTTAKDAREMDCALAASRIDLLVLDLNLPGEDGLSICRRLRVQGSPLPIVMLTAKGEEIDRIIGLEMGADDYLPKPFNPRELLARIRSVLRRRTREAESIGDARVQVFSFAGWQLNVTVRELLSPEGAKVAVTGAELDLLHAFCERPGRVLSRDQLLDLTQGRFGGPYERSIDVLVSRLRHKIEPDPKEPEIIKTVRSGGYLFTPRVERRS